MSERAGPHGGADRGVLLVQLGTPSAPTPAALRRWLRQFLGDPRVVHANRVLWWLVLNAIVLPRRARVRARAYEAIWTPDGPPLLVHTRALARELGERLAPSVRVRFAMRYGEPSIERELDALVAEGCRRIRVLALFPQHSDTTTGSVHAAVRRWASRARARPAIELAPSFPIDPGYLDALAGSIGAALPAPRGDERYVLSFHGLPRAYVERGDPYADECRATARALARRLGWPDDRWSLVWQSRFGRGAWLEPAADQLVPEIARGGAPVIVVTPGFVADCLETLEELGIELRRLCRERSGNDITIVPCLNSSDAWIRALEALATTELDASDRGNTP